jgi:hypothetical protein
VAAVSDQGLYPAEHRGLRELHATARALVRHWDKLAARLGEPAAAPLLAGAADARSLLGELAERGAAHDVHGVPAAQAAGRNIAALRRGGDRFLERNQALRLAMLDVQHVATLLAWLGALAERRGDTGWLEFHTRWGGRMTEAESALRTAVLALAADPEAATAPADPSAVGRAGARLGMALGTVGEAVDASALGRAVRRRH